MVGGIDNLGGVGPEGGNINVEKGARDRHNRWDVGVAVGVEWILMPKDDIHSMRLGLRYYQGFMDVTANDNVTVTNIGFMLTLGVPI
jgi:hypothetical protein